MGYKREWRVNILSWCVVWIDDGPHSASTIDHKTSRGGSLRKRPASRCSSAPRGGAPNTHDRRGWYAAAAPRTESHDDCGTLQQRHCETLQQRPVETLARERGSEGERVLKSS